MPRRPLIIPMVLCLSWAGCDSCSNRDDGSGDPYAQPRVEDDSPGDGQPPIGVVEGADFYGDRVMVVEDPASGNFEVTFFDCVELGPRCRPASCLEPFANNVVGSVGVAIPLWPKPGAGSTYGVGSELSLIWGVNRTPPSESRAEELSFRLDELDGPGNRAVGNFTWRQSERNHVVSDFEADYCPTKVVPREYVEPINRLSWGTSLVLPARVPPFPLEGTLAGLPFEPHHITLLHGPERADLVLFNGPVSDPCQGPISNEFADDVATNPAWPGWQGEERPPDYFHLEIRELSMVTSTGFLAAQYDDRQGLGRLRAEVRWFEPGGYRSTIWSVDWSAAVIFDHVYPDRGTVLGRVYLAFDDPGKSFALGTFQGTYCVSAE